VPAVDVKVAVHGEHLAVPVLLAHAHQAGVSKIHGPIRVRRHQLFETRLIAAHVVGNPDDPNVQYPQHPSGIAKCPGDKVTGFGDDRFAGVEDGKPLEPFYRPVMVLIIGIEDATKRPASAMARLFMVARFPRVVQVRRIGREVAQPASRTDEALGPLMRRPRFLRLGAAGSPALRRSSSR